MAKAARQVKLWCGVYGGNGIYFPITIDINPEFTVCDLRKAIIDMKKKENQWFNVDPNEVGLYFTRKKDEDGTWTNEWLVEINEQLEDWLKNGRQVNDSFSKMVAGFGLETHYLRGCKPGDLKLHVLVELPHFGQIQPTISTASNFFKRKADPQEISRSLKRSRIEGNSTDTDQQLNWGFVTSTIDGVSLYEPIFPRDELIHTIYTEINQFRFVVLTSPATSGKTSTLILFRAKYPEMECIYVQMNCVDTSGFEILKSKQINLQNESFGFTVDPAKRYIFMLDDAQARYTDTDFWTSLIKGSPTWMPPNISFIICATHAIDSDVESPTVLKYLPCVHGREFFLLNNDQALAFLRLEPPTGLSPIMRDDTIITIIIHQCCGLIGALRLTCMTLRFHFLKATSLDKTQVIRFLYSQDFVESMSRCFGSSHTSVENPNLKKLLIKCLTSESNAVYNPFDFTNEENDSIIKLQKCGILDCSRYTLKYASPLARRYFFRWLFPHRAEKNPASLRELIESVIASMSASVLKKSVVDNNDFPKKATFQYLFMEGITRNTTLSTSLCPELSQEFPSPTSINSGAKINGAIDFYLNGELRWGIELLVNNAGIGEHLQRFGPSGRYADLRALDYIVIDIRGNTTGAVTNITKSPDRVTIFFKKDDYSSCQCFFGMDNNPVMITLEN